MPTEERQCFVISPIGQPNSITRERADKVFRHIIKPVAEACSYTAIRADQMVTPGIITTQVIQAIVDAPLVIADLSEHNPNVFYELAIRHAVRKPLIQIIQKGDPIPFDVAPTRTIEFDISDLDNVAEAKEQMILQIRSFGDSTSVQTPISVAIDLQSLRQSTDPESRSIADLIDAFSGIRSTLVALEKKVDSLTSNGNRSDWLNTLSYRRHNANTVLGYNKEDSWNNLIDEGGLGVRCLIEQVMNTKATPEEKNKLLARVLNLLNLKDSSPESNRKLLNVLKSAILELEEKSELAATE